MARPRLGRNSTASNPSARDLESCAQRRGLVGTAEDVESIGCNARGVFGPGMIVSESFFVSSESGLAENERFARNARSQ
ncbi:MAG: hypothetical protein WA624_19340 [Methylocella sp.]